MPKRIPWNQDRRVGPRTALTRRQLNELEDLFIIKESWHDHALLFVAVDTMLRCGDLLRLKVEDVMVGNKIRRSFYYEQEKTGEEVAPILSDETQEACLKWITFSGKKRNDYLFTRHKPPHGLPISKDRYRKVVKEWVELIGLNNTDYSSHSLRRTKPIYMYRQGSPIENISELLGHEDIRSTKKYLGLTIAHAHKEALKHNIFKRK